MQEVNKDLIILYDKIDKAEAMMKLAEVEMKLEQQKIDDAMQRYALYKGRYATVKSYRDSLINTQIT